MARSQRPYETSSFDVTTSTADIGPNMDSERENVLEGIFGKLRAVYLTHTG